MIQRITFLAILFLFSVTSYSQVSFSNTFNSILSWPFEDSFFITFDDGSNGWELLRGSTFHQESDLHAQDWHIGDCVSPDYTCGQKLLAPFDGVVIADATSAGYGNQILLQSTEDENFAMRLAHLLSRNVSKGDVVSAGDVIGLVGDTGNGGCHVHLALYKNILDTVPSEGGTYLDKLLNNIQFRIDGSNISAPFVLSANKDDRIKSVLNESNEFFLEDNNTLSGILTNTSLTEDRTLDLFLTIRNMETETPLDIFEKNAVYVPFNNQTLFEFDTVFEQEGTYRITLSYFLESSIEFCFQDMLQEKVITVYSKEKCYGAEEPNNSIEEAFNMTSILQRNFQLSSFLSSETVTSDDIDYFSIDFDTPGILKINETIQNSFVNIVGFIDDAMYSLADLKAGIDIEPGSTLILEVSGILPENKECAGYAIDFLWKQEGELLFIYPNPSNGAFSIKIPIGKKRYEVNIFDSRGVLVYNTQMISMSSDLKIDGTGLSSGLYFVELKINGSTGKSFKVVIN